MDAATPQTALACEGAPGAAAAAAPAVKIGATPEEQHAEPDASGARGNRLAVHRMKDWAALTMQGTELGNLCLDIDILTE